MFAVLMASPVFSQKAIGNKGHAEKKKEMMEFKLKFLADAIDLKEDQRKQFNEVYSQMDQERWAVMKSLKKTKKELNENKKASETDYEQACAKMAADKEKMAQIEKKYDEKLATFLTKKQLFKLKEAEATFMEKLRECRDKKKKGK